MATRMMLRSQQLWKRVSVPADGRALCARGSKFDSLSAKPRQVTFLLSKLRSIMPIWATKDHAFEWLNTAYQERDIWLTSLLTEPQIDSLRSDPRYDELVRKI